MLVGVLTWRCPTIPAAISFVRPVIGLVKLAESDIRQLNDSFRLFHHAKCSGLDSLCH